MNEMKDHPIRQKIFNIEYNVPYDYKHLTLVINLPHFEQWELPISEMMYDSSLSLQLRVAIYDERTNKTVAQSSGPFTGSSLLAFLIENHFYDIE